TVCWPPGRTCGNWPATGPRPPRTTWRRRGTRPACPNVATWPSRPRGWRPPPGRRGKRGAGHAELDSRAFGVADSEPLSDQVVDAGAAHHDPAPVLRAG